MQLSQQIPPINEDCSNLHLLPPLRFKIDGQMLELPPQAYVMRVTGASMEANDLWDVLFFKPKVRKTDMCMPAFMQIDMETTHGPAWILGNGPYMGPTRVRVYIYIYMYINTKYI